MWMLIKLVVLALAVVVGVAVYQVAVDEGMLPPSDLYQGQGAQTRGWSDYSSTAAPRPGPSVPSGYDTPYAGPAPNTNVYRHFDCSNDLGRLQNEMQNAYSEYLRNQNRWNHDSYMYYKEQYDAAVAQCRNRY